jgi:sugar lactone lactonase YvrE
VKIKHEKIKQKSFTRTFFRISLIILLISACIQVMPFEVEIIDDTSASSTWFETNWLAQENYSSVDSIDIILSSGDLKLHYEDESLLIADTNNNRLVKTRKNGTGWATFGTNGLGIGQFSVPSGLTYDKNTGYIYVTDYASHRIIKTKWGGSGWATYGTLGVYTSGKGYFYHPNGISFDSSTDFIYVTDVANNRIVKTMMNGSGWTTLGNFTPGTGVKQFYFPSGIYYDKTKDDLYISDSGNSRIIKTKMNGNGWTTLSSFNYPNDIQYDSGSGFIYVADTNNNCIVKTMINGSGLSAYGSYGNATGQFLFPQGVYYDNTNGYVYVADTGNCRIVKTKMNGSDWTTYGSKGNGKGQFHYPRDIEYYDSHHNSAGYLTSRKFNYSSPANLLTLNWVGDTPAGTSIKFQLRTAPNSTLLSSKDFVGPNGSSSGYYTKSGQKLWFWHDGDQWIQYKVYLRTNNLSITPILRDVTITYNLLPDRPILTGPANNSWVNNNRPTFTWTFIDRDSASQSAFQWLMANISDFDSVDYDGKTVISTNSSFIPASPISDGIWYWWIRTQDSDNGWGPYSIPWKILIDTKTPSSIITTPVNNKYYYTLNNISGYAMDPNNGSGLNNIEITIQRLSDDNYWDGTDWLTDETWLVVSGTDNWTYDSALVDWSSGIKYRIISRATDRANNIEAPGIGIILTIDNERPSSTIEFPIDKSILRTLPAISGIAEDPGDAGVNKIEICIKRTKDNMYWSGEKWSRSQSWLLANGTSNWKYDVNSVLWTSNTLYSVQSRATDNISNIELPSKGNLFTLDFDLPSSKITFPLNNTYLNSLNTITGSSYDIGVSGIKSVDICIKQTIGFMDLYWNSVRWSSSEHWLTVGGIDEWSFDSRDVLWETDNQYVVTSRATDMARNIEQPGFRVTFMYDDQPPLGSIIINNGEEYIRSNDVTLSLTGDDTGSGVAQIAFSVDNESWSTWQPFIPEKSFILPLLDGSKIVYFKVQDRAGNIADPVFDTIVLDTTPPEPTFIINENAEYTKTTAVILDLQAIDALSGLHQMSFSFDSTTWTLWELYQTKKSITLPEEDGGKIIHFRVNDKAGNIGIISDSIVLDTAPPYSLSIEANLIDSDSKSILFNLRVSALDNLSGVSQMSFSTDESTWDEWVNFSNIKYYTLPASGGEKFVYFKVKDRAGNTAEPISLKLPAAKNQPPVKSSYFTEHWYILFIILIVIIIVIILVFIKKRKKPGEKTESPPKDAVTIKPGTVPKTGISVGELPTAPTLVQLPKSTTNTESQQPTLSIQKVPTLASSTTPGQVPETQQIPQVTQVPQLPSAQPETSETIKESGEEPTPNSDQSINIQQETDESSHEKD